jgi:hypothetical protein
VNPVPDLNFSPLSHPTFSPSATVISVSFILRSLIMKLAKKLRNQEVFESKEIIIIGFAGFFFFPNHAAAARPKMSYLFII